MDGVKLSLYIQLASLIYIVLIAIVFFVKKKAHTIENKLFGVITIENIIGLLIVIAFCFISKHYTNDSLLLINFKGIILYIAIWILTFTVYIYIISHGIKYEYKDENQEKWKEYIKFKRIMYVLGVISGLLILILPLEIIHEENIYANPKSLSYIFTFLICILCSIFWFGWLLTNKDKKISRKYYPIFAFIVFGTVSGVVQFLVPYLAIVVPVETFITILIFFTMENPDIKLVEYVKTEKDRALKLSESKTEFLSNMSKELRTPLASIIGISEDLETYNVESNDIKEDVRDISNASKTLLEIIANIMDISKIEGGKFDITPSDYNPKEEFESLAKIMRTKVNEKPIEFTVKISETLPEVLFGDRVRIKQIINNFLSNAIKYTEKGNVDFIVEWYDASQSLFIKVSDTGRGVKPEDIDRLFAKYDRLSVEKVSAVQGTGLGLAITKEIIEMMGGEVKVESEFGKGTSFMVTLPQQIGNKERYELANKDNNSKVDFDFSGKKILVIDDNQLNIKTLRKTLKSFNLQIDECYTGKEGIEKVLINNYDLILTDIGMPEMSGEEVLSTLKSNPNFKTPIVAITAEAMTGAKEKYLEMGFDDYILKPVTKKVIANKLNKFLNK